MNVIDSSPYADEKSLWRQAAHGRTAASLHAESSAALHAGSPDMALSLIELALAGGAADPLYRCHHASCLKTLSRFAEAEKAYWNILREHPDTVELARALSCRRPMWRDPGAGAARTLAAPSISAPLAPCSGAPTARTELS